MNKSIRQVLLFVVIIAIGSAMVLFDIPAILLFAGAGALGLMVLVLSGAVTEKDLRKRKPAPENRTKETRTPAKEPADKIPVPAKETTENPPKPAKKEKGKRAPGEKGPGIIATMRKAFSVLSADLRRTGKGREKRTKEIDSMLDRSVTGAPISVLDGFAPEVVPPTRQELDDPFRSLITEDMDGLDTGLLDQIEEPADMPLLAEFGMPETPPAAGGGGGGEARQLDVGIASEDGSITLDDEQDDEVASILAANMEDLEPETSPGQPAETEEIDFSSIDLDQELKLDGGQDTEAEPAAPARAPAAAGAPAPSAAPITKGGPADSNAIDESSMVSFASGDHGSDDLLSSLKSDIKTEKKSEKASLIRDLKDVKVGVGDLQSELEGILSIPGRKAAGKR
jgi:hypothetical protein